LTIGQEKEDAYSLELVIHDVCHVNGVLVVTTFTITCSRAVYDGEALSVTQPVADLVGYIGRLCPCAMAHFERVGLISMNIATKEKVSKCAFANTCGS